MSGSVWVALGFQGPGLITLGAYPTREEAQARADDFNYDHTRVMQIDLGPMERWQGLFYAFEDNTFALNASLEDKARSRQIYPIVVGGNP